MNTDLSPGPDNDELLRQLQLNGRVPRHVAVIMDGNGRWAGLRNLPRPMGHKAGMKSVREIIEGAIDAGIEILTLFAFSQENWSRPPVEVSALMMLLEEYIARETDDLIAQGVAANILGDRSRLGKRARSAVERVEQQTAGGTKLQLNLCISYSGREELVRAARMIAADVAAGRLAADTITEDDLAERLYTAPWGDPDLLIRTSGEQRISNFLLWQVAYTEIHVVDVLWPDFTRHHLYDAVLEYQRRERRYGRVTA